MKRASSHHKIRSLFRPLVAMFFSALITVFALVVHAQSEENERDMEVLAKPIVGLNDSGAYAEVNKLPDWLRRSAPFARTYYEFERVAGTAGVFDWEAYFKAYKQAQDDRKRELGIAYKAARPLGTWHNIGVSSTSPVSYSAGCTVAIAFDPTNADIMYAGAQGGGVWKSINHGASWVPLTDDYLPNMTVASIAVDPNNGSTLWVGTGECNAGIISYGGSGLWRSKNAGVSWERVDLGTKNAGNAFVKVLVDPSNSSVVFASSYDGSSRGVYRTEDGGGTWTRVFGSGGVVWDIVAGKVEGGQQTYFLADGNESNAGIFKSVDDGKTWTKLNSANFPAATRIGRTALAVASASTDKVFALMADAGNGDSLAYMTSVDAGQTWQSNPIPANLFKSPFAGGGAQGWYDNCIVVHPSGSPVYIGGVQAFVDYGQGWQIWSGYGDQLKSSPHVDHHVLALDPRNPSTMFNGNDGGLYMSTDAGRSWVYRSTDMVTNRVYRIAFERINQSAVWAGMQDQGTWRIGVGSDSSFFGGDGFQPITYPVSSSIIYYELYDGNVWRSSNFHGGASAELASDLLSGDGAYWDAPFKMSAVGHAGGNSYDLLYLGRQNLWRATDGSNFKKVANTAFGYPYITAIGLSPSNSDVLAIGGSGKIMISTNFGTSWTTKTTGFPGAMASSIEMTGRNPQFIIASFRSSGANHIMVSNDLGGTWTAVGAGIPVGVESVTLDSTSPESTWYAATDLGVYYTTDAGQGWRLSAGLPLIVCRDLQLRKDGTVMRVATYGRGVWEVTLPLESRSVTSTTLEAVKTAAGTELKWTIEGEPDGRTFEVQRSIGDEGFQTIGQVAEAGMRSFNFTDPSTASGSYTFRIASTDASGERSFSNIVELTYGSNALIVHDPRPNPLNRGESININYELPSRQEVTVTIFSMTGVKIATLVEGQMREPGAYSEHWDGHDVSGALVAAGTYLVQVSAGELGSHTTRISVR